MLSYQESDSLITPQASPWEGDTGSYAGLTIIVSNFLKFQTLPLAVPVYQSSRTVKALSLSLKCENQAQSFSFPVQSTYLPGVWPKLSGVSSWLVTAKIHFNPHAFLP